MQHSKEQELKKFKSAYKHKSSELYPKARATCVTKSIEKARKPSSLPDETTFKMLKMFMTSEISFLVENYDIRNYVWLRSLVVARLTLYNARRSEEAARMLQKEWEDACAGVWIPEGQVEKVKDQAQRFLLGQYKLAYLKGKGRKYVPVLVPLDLINPLNILNRDRKEFGKNEKNIFLFATKKSSQSHCSGWHAVSEVCKRANVDLPVNATKMRHRLSSMFASLAMNANDKKIFMDHIGHDEQINKDNYQCPPGIQAIQVMGKMLSDADKAQTLSCFLASNASLQPVGTIMSFNLTQTWTVFFFSVFGTFSEQSDQTPTEPHDQLLVQRSLILSDASKEINHMDNGAKQKPSSEKPVDKLADVSVSDQQTNVSTSLIQSSKKRSIEKRLHFLENEVKELRRAIKKVRRTESEEPSASSTMVSSKEKGINEILEVVNHLPPGTNEKEVNKCLKKLCFAIFSKEEMVNCSRTGKKTIRSPDAEARPALDKQKMEILEKAVLTKCPSLHTDVLKKKTI